MENTIFNPRKMAKYIGFTESEVMELRKKHNILNYKNELENNPKNENNKDNEELNNENQMTINKSNKEIEKNKNQIDNELINKNKIKVTLNDLNEWYRGYQLIDESTNQEYKIYAPYSIVNAINNNFTDYYWCKNDNNEMLQKLLDYQYFGFKEDIGLLINGKRVKCSH